MNVYLTRLTELVVWCAELSTYSLGSVSSPQWPNLVKEVDDFFDYYNLKNTEEYRRFTYAVSNSSSGFNYGFGGRDSIEKDIFSILFNLRQYENLVPKYFDRVFISHSSKDVDIVKPLVKLLTSIGLTKDKLFCSSIDGYGIPQRENIYDYLKREFTDKNTFVILMLSNNYYESKPSLNEMGAAWVMSKEYVSILIKGFEFDKIQGAADSQKIGFKIEDKYRLDEFKNNLVKELRIKGTTSWSADRDRFLAEIAEVNKTSK